MAELYQQLKPKSKYYDRANFQSQEEYDKKLENTTTVYVGNLSFYTSQDSLFQLFSRCGQVEDIKMGINNQGNPAGFCFVIFNNHQQARRAVQYLSHTKLWQRIIRVDWDPGYKQGRQKGRGTGGHQKRDEYRSYEDNDRPMKNPNKKVHTERGEYRDNRNYRDNYGSNNRGQNRDRNNNRDYNNRDYRKGNQSSNNRGQKQVESEDF